MHHSRISTFAFATNPKTRKSLNAPLRFGRERNRLASMIRTNFVKDAENTTIPDLAAAIDKSTSPKPATYLEIDLERYQGYLDDPALCSEQKTKIVEALWSIITTFVELGFGVHPVQLACGKHGTELENAGNSESTGVLSNQERQQGTDAPAL